MRFLNAIYELEMQYMNWWMAHPTLIHLGNALFLIGIVVWVASCVTYIVSSIKAWRIYKKTMRELEDVNKWFDK